MGAGLASPRETRARSHAWSHPAQLLRQLDPSVGDPDTVLLNEAVIEEVRAIVRGFPYKINDAKERDMIEEMRELDTSHFKPNESKKFKNGDGTFTYKGPMRDRTKK